jgi:hypothetical protein
MSAITSNVSVSTVGQELVNLVKSELAAKRFSTGSKGFFATEKITVDGQRYQAQAQAVLIGSKDNPRVEVQASTAEIISALTTLIQDDLAAVEFKSGKSGFRVQGKLQAHGQRFQASVQAVKLVS